MRAIVLAGGKGTRLLPYTIVVPKPMLPLNDIPIIEIISRQLKYHGFQEVSISLGHLSGVIKYFLESKKGDKGLPNFTYFTEDEPLGTSGPVKAINPNEEDFLVINGDILTSMDLLTLYNEHRKSGAALTISARNTTYTLPVGKLEIDASGSITNFQEKPKIDIIDNIGVYIYTKRALNYIDLGENIDVNVLCSRLIQEGERVYAYMDNGHYYWIDIGTHADYEKANREFSNIKSHFPFLTGI